MNSGTEAAFFGLTGALTILWLSRELPLQYVLSVALITAGIGATAGLLLKTDGWWLPVIVLNSRGVVRFALQKWQERAYYGWWVIGLGCLLSTALKPGWTTPALAMVMQLAALPWLIKRKPASTPSALPLLALGLIVAGGLLGFFATP